MVKILFDLANYHYAFPAWPPFIVGSCTLLLGIFVVLRERISRVSLAFLWLTVAGSVWLMSVAAIYSANSKALALLWARIEHVGVVFIPSALLYFTLLVVRRLERYRTLAHFSLAVSGAFALTVLFTNNFITGFVNYPWGPYPQLGFLGAAFLVFFFALCISSLASYRSLYRGMARGPQQDRLKRFFLAFCVGLLGVIDYFASFHIRVYPVGYLPVYACVLMLAEIIWQYRFPDITPAFAVTEIVATIPAALLVLDHDGIICIVNKMTCELFGKSETELVGSPIRTLLSGFPHLGQMESKLMDGSLQDYEANIRSSDGGPSRICSFSTSIMRDSQQRPLAYVCLGRDLTPQKNAEQALLTSEARFWRLVDSNIIGFMIVDENGAILETNDAFLRMLGYTRAEFAAGHVGGDGMTPPEYAPMDEWMLEKLQATGSCPPLEKEYIRKDGSRVPVLVGVVQLERSQKSYVCFVIDATDRRRAMEALQKAYDELELRVNERTKELQQEIVLRQKAEEALRNQSITDILTGLYNRRGFMTLAEQHLQLARRNQAEFLFFMADVDDLKPINDTFGHAEGDLALTQAAAVLKQTFRGSDIVARIGGDEFAVAVLEDSNNNESALMARLREKLDDYNRYSGRPYKLGLSMGSIRINPQNTTTVEQLMAQADVALYEKKKQKRPLPGKLV